MFGSKRGLADKLREQGGVEASGTIVDAATLWTSDRHTDSGDDEGPGSTKHCEVTVKVEPEAEPAFEEKFKQPFSDHIPHPGQQAKVVYDPKKHSKIAILEDTMSWGDGPVKNVVVGPDEPANLFGGAPIQVTTTTPSSTPDVADALTKLADLRDRGVLTDAEFETQKAKLLAGS